MFSYTSTTTENRRDRLAEYVFREKITYWKGTPEGLAYHCYQYADAMIAQGEVEDEGVEEASEEPKVVRINLNSKIRVKLTDHGRALHTKGHAELLTSASLRPPCNQPKEDAEGWSTWQLWVLMQAFGPHMYLGCPSPFESDMEVIE